MYVIQPITFSPVTNSLSYDLAFPSYLVYHDAIELSVKKPCLHPVFGPPFTRYALFQCYSQSKDTRFETNYSSYTGMSSENKFQHIFGIICLRVLCPFGIPSL